MQQRNVILFVILSIGILAGWFWLVNPMDQTKKGDPDLKKLAQIKDDEKDKGKKKDDAKDKDKKEIKQEKKPEPEKKKVPEIKPTVKEPEKEKEEPAKIATLGGDGFHLMVDTTTLGAGVRRVVLNRFKAANWRGLPTERDLELIQDDEFSPSFRMNHFPEPKAIKPLPAFGLGEKNWTFEGKKELADKVQEVRYSSKVPGMDEFKIFKTYRLGPKDYHVTLLLEFHDERTDKAAKPRAFRYQLTGGHGLPIEGEWYTSIFRNAVIGVVDQAGSLDRRLEESARISPRRGGDRFPDELGGNRLQYAGTVNQFFAVMIVPDKDQPDGADAGKILEWARPTWESQEKRGHIINIGDDAIIFRDIDSGIAADKLGSLIREQTAQIADTREGKKDDEKLANAQKEIAKKTASVKNSAYSHRASVESLLTKANDLMKQAAKNIEAREMVEAIDAQSNAIELLKQAREQLTVPVRYLLLTRTKQHIKDLDLQEGQKLVLSCYGLPDGRQVATWVRLGETPRAQFDDITMRVNSSVMELLPGDKVGHQFLLYHGPVKAALLAQFTGDKEVPAELVDRYTDTFHLRTLTDYRSDNFFGTISSKIYLTNLIILFTRLMHWLLNQLHYVFGYGFSIIVLTVIVRGCMFPISRRQALFSIKMQELAPEMKKITERYKDDMQARSQAMMELQRKHGVSTWASCWPVFLQMPIFLGLYFALQESIHFRLAPFLWIESLAAPDMTLFWSDHIPQISNPDNLGGMLYLGPYLNVLPMVAVVLMMVQQMQTMPPPTDEQQAMQQKMLKYMTIFFGIMFYKVAAGLCIYFISSSLWGMAERKLLPKKKPPAEAPTPTTAQTPAAKGPQNTKWKGKPSKVEKKEETGITAKAMAWWKEVLKQAEKK